MAKETKKGFVEKVKDATGMGSDKPTEEAPVEPTEEAPVEPTEEAPVEPTEEAPVEQVDSKDLVKMVREVPEGSDDPTTCDVHPNEVSNYAKGGWVKA